MAERHLSGCLWAKSYSMKYVLTGTDISNNRQLHIWEKHQFAPLKVVKVMAPLVVLGLLPKLGVTRCAAHSGGKGLIFLKLYSTNLITRCCWEVCSKAQQVCKGILALQFYKDLYVTIYFYSFLPILPLEKKQQLEKVLFEHSNVFWLY